MQRVSAFLPSWEKRNSTSDAPKTTSTFFGWSGRHHGQNDNSRRNSHTATNTTINTPGKTLARIDTAAANGGKVQKEAFWPSTLDVECVKAARILKSFCSDGYLAPMEASTPQIPEKIMKKIPKRIIQNAAGIAVFTCMRNGLWMTGSGGSGILIARKSDGTWSPPSGIMLHTPTLSFIIDVDVYDCVLVVTNLSALESLTRARVTLGDDIELNTGPSVPLDSEDIILDWKDLDNSVLTYMKARGQHQAVSLASCILTERGNENERFYGVDATQMDILAGNVARHIEATKPLFEVIKMAEGRTDYDSALIERTAAEPAPGDALIATPSSTPASPMPSFGVPKADDPDPFGVLALEMAGLEIREAGTRLRPTSSQFELGSNPRSPTLSKFGRLSRQSHQSIDTFLSKSNRASVMSSRTVRSQMTDAGTQTSVGHTPDTTPSPRESKDGHEADSIDQIPEAKEEEEHEEVDYTAIDLTPLRHLSQRHSIKLVLPEEPTAAPSKESNGPKDPASAPRTDNNEDRPTNEPDADHDDEIDYDTNDADDEDDLDESDEEPVVYEIAQVQPTQTKAVASRVIQAKGSVVTIAKRVPPPLPTRSPARAPRNLRGEVGVETVAVLSPLRQAFSEADLVDEPRDQDRVAQTESASTETRKSSENSRINASDAVDAQPEDESTLGDKINEESPVNEGAQPMTSLDEVVAMPSTLPNETSKKETEEGTSHSHVSAQPAASVTEEQQDRYIGAEQDVSGNARLSDNEDDRLPGDVDFKSALFSANDFDSTLASDESPFAPEPTDNSDSTTSQRYPSSNYTGMTEDRWSIDRSSLTTPTSERPGSVADYTEDESPKKLEFETKSVAKEHGGEVTVKSLESTSETTITPV